MKKYSKDVDFAGTKMPKDLTGFVFENCQFDASTDFTRCKLNKAEFHRCTFNGVDFSVAAGARGLLFWESKLENTNLSNKQLYDMQMKMSSLIRCDLSKANLNNAVFESTDCTGSHFTRSIWFNARFSSCNFEGCELGFLVGPEYSDVEQCMNAPPRLLQRTKTRLRFNDLDPLRQFMRAE